MHFDVPACCLRHERKEERMTLESSRCCSANDSPVKVDCDLCGRQTCSSCAEVYEYEHLSTGEDAVYAVCKYCVTGIALNLHGHA
jgi:hypothetical protein